MFAMPPVSAVPLAVYPAAGRNVDDAKGCCEGTRKLDGVTPEMWVLSGVTLG